MVNLFCTRTHGPYQDNGYWRGAPTQKVLSHWRNQSHAQVVWNQLRLMFAHWNDQLNDWEQSRNKIKPHHYTITSLFFCDYATEVGKKPPRCRQLWLARLLKLMFQSRPCETSSRNHFQRNGWNHSGCGIGCMLWPFYSSRQQRTPLFRLDESQLRPENEDCRRETEACLCEYCCHSLSDHYEYYNY
jgi:hypothetical protein